MSSGLRKKNHRLLPLLPSMLRKTSNKGRFPLKTDTGALSVWLNNLCNLSSFTKCNKLTLPLSGICQGGVMINPPPALPRSLADFCRAGSGLILLICTHWRQCNSRTIHMLRGMLIKGEHNSLDSQQLHHNELCSIRLQNTHAQEKFIIILS